MGSRLLFAAALAGALVACKKKDADQAGSGTAAKPAEPAGSGTAARPADPPAGSAAAKPAEPPAPPPPPAAPAWVGEATAELKIEKVRDKPVLITAPASFAVTIEGEDDEESLPSAKLAGAGVEVWIRFPDLGFVDADSYATITHNGDPQAEVLRADDTADGVVYVVRRASGSWAGKFSVAVTRPKLELECTATVGSKAEAERVVTLCESLRAE